MEHFAILDIDELFDSKPTPQMIAREYDSNQTVFLCQKGKRKFYLTGSGHGYKEVKVGDTCSYHLDQSPSKKGYFIVLGIGQATKLMPSNTKMFHWTYEGYFNISESQSAYCMK